MSTKSYPFKAETVWLYMQKLYIILNGLNEILPYSKVSLDMPL